MAIDETEASDATQAATPESVEHLYKRVLRLALVAAVLMLPFGVGLATREQYEWVGKGGRSAYPTIWSTIIPPAAIFALSVPYVVLASLASSRARLTGYVARMLGVSGIVICVVLLFLPSAWGVPLIIWIGATLFGPAVLFGAAQLGLLVAAWWTCKRLNRLGQALDDARHDAGELAGPAMTATVIAALYVIAWCVTFVIPGDMARNRLAEANTARLRAAEAERARLPKGAPLMLAWKVDAFPGQSRTTSNTETFATLGRDGTIYGAFQEGVVALDANGHVRWRDTSVRQRMSAAVPDSNGLVYIGGSDGTLHALRSTDGTVAWRAQVVPAKETRFGVYTPLIGADGSVYAVGDAGPFASALDRYAPDGRRLRHVDLAMGVVPPLTGGLGDTMYVAGVTQTPYTGLNLQAIAPTGELAWRTETKTGYMKSIRALRDGSIAVAGWDGLVLFSRAGQRMEKQESEDDIVGLE